MSVIKPTLQFPERIAYLSGANNYCWVCFQDGERKLLAKPISYLEQMLPHFLRIHKTTLINPTYIKRFEEPPRRKMSGKVFLENGEAFSVSRRRWQQIFETIQEQLADKAPKAEPTPPASVIVRKTPAKTQQGIWLVTHHKELNALTAYILQQQWPEYGLHAVPQSTYLPDILHEMPERDYPTLLLLDARTATLERLHTLQRLKEDAQLCRIPIILLVSATDQEVIRGYQYQANSVVSLPTGFDQLDQIVERICQFWLKVVVLPRPAR